MVTVDNGRCTGCGICLDLRQGYCLTGPVKKIGIVEELCNECLQCVAVCPGRAFTVEGLTAERVNRDLVPTREQMRELLLQRRSIRHFKDGALPRDLVEEVIRIGRYAPSMNHGIEVLAIDDPDVLEQIDRSAQGFYEKLYRWLFKPRLAYAFISLFADDLHLARKKLKKSMAKGHTLYQAPVLLIALGDTRVPVTEASGHYILSTMTLYAEALGLATCLMDSVKIALRANRGLARELGVPKGWNVLGAVHMGYPATKVLNKLEGLSIPFSWNRRGG